MGFYTKINANIALDTPENLVLRIRQGDRSAEDELVSRYAYGLSFALRRSCGEAELAADLTQETLLKVIENARSGSIDKPQALATYIQNMGEYMLIHYKRREKRRATDADAELQAKIADTAPGLVDLVQDQQQLTLVQTLIDTYVTNERQREVLKLYFIYGKDKGFLCETLGLSPGNFDTILSRARRVLHNLVELHLSQQDLAYTPNSTRTGVNTASKVTLLLLLMLLQNNGLEENSKKIVNGLTEIPLLRHCYNQGTQEVVPSMTRNTEQAVELRCA